MAAYLNRTLNLMSGDGAHATGRSAQTVLPPRSNLNENSPLQIFVKAKKKINDIFVEIEDCVLITANYINSLHGTTNDEIISLEDCKAICEYQNKVKAIRDVLLRDHMKVAFFGRTSNGKSTVINAMLHEKILPSGIGHTTNCFLQVEGSDSKEAYLQTEQSTEKQNVKSVAQLAHALCQEKLGESELVKIFWPRDKCALLRDDVVFVDSPGVDVTPNLDEWIDKHCLDADVFVLVANAESTLMVTEKNFFHKVSTKLSKPNIFILNNRWDASANEIDYLDKVKMQHQQRAIDFLVKELKVYNPKEAEERIFFISAKEALHTRLQEQGQQSHTPLVEGFQTRYFEFINFEQKFQECISKSAIKTKFDQHSQRGKQISIDIKNILDTVYEKSSSLKEKKVNEKKDMNDKIIFCEQKLIEITHEMKDKIRGMVEDVELRVSQALQDEIKRLSNLVDEFNLPFHTEPLVLNVYKKQLHLHVENGLGSNLRNKLSNALAMNIESSQEEMTERMSSILPDTKRKVLTSILPKRTEPFQILYRLNCDNLCVDFHEDLQFKFSWGIRSLIQRFQNSSQTNFKSKNKRHIIYNEEHHKNEIDSESDVSMSLQPYEDVHSLLNSDEWSFISKMAFASVGSQGTIGSLLLGGFLLKTVGWRFIAVLGTIYGGLYLYERLTWTNKAKEKLFKQQYVRHCTKKLKLIVDLTSANCSHQVQQELSSTFARLCHLVDENQTEMLEKSKKIDLEIQKLEEAVTNSKIFRNKANYLINELQLFDDAYIKSSN